MTKGKDKRKHVASPVDKHVGRRLKRRRTITGVAQATLAEKCNITFQQIQKYEQGLNRVSAGRLWEFSRLLDVPVTYFYEGIDRSDGSLETDFEDQLFEPENAEVLENYHKIPDRELKTDFRQFLKSMARVYKHER